MVMLGRRSGWTWCSLGSVCGRRERGGFFMIRICSKRCGGVLEKVWLCYKSLFAYFGRRVTRT